MRIWEAEERTPRLLEQLTAVWESSVRATHHFLSPEEIAAIRPYVPQALGNVAHLVVTEGADGILTAFMGVENHRLEMLFLSPASRGKGLGKRLLRYGIEHYDVRDLAVNEQNPQAMGFYEHMGFRAYKRTETDNQGNPYPLIYMKL